MTRTATGGFTSADLEALPEIPGIRYEIIDGELYVSRAVNVRHQIAVGQLHFAFGRWDEKSERGLAVSVPGVVFAEDDDVIPDFVWVSRARLARILDEKGHFRAAPELVVEVLSPGRANAFRDREAKLDLYSRRGVQEYWIVDWQQHLVEVFRRRGDSLDLVESLRGGDTLTSPLLPGFACSVSTL